MPCRSHHPTLRFGKRRVSPTDHAPLLRGGRLSDLPKDSLFIGGAPRNDFVRFSIDHIAYAMPEELRELLLKFINKSIHPFVRDRGLDWEIHIDDTPRNQWTVQGMRPPDSGSDEEKRWIRKTGRPNQPRTPQRKPKQAGFHHRVWRRAV